ncbi:MAG: glycosyltransferase family 2 protein [Sphingomonas sp.]|nr:glycosyltransferase family 2 protein [Sphingomonas sp.]
MTNDNASRNLASYVPGLVSVIMIFLDGEPFIDEAIGSVIEQRYPHWELLLVDDGSRDGSTGTAQRFAAEQQGRIHYLEHSGHENCGMSASRNLGLRHARGEFVVFLDADDIWLPENLKRQVAVMRGEPHAALVYGPLHFWYGWTGDPADAGRDFVCPMGGEYGKLIPPPRMLLRQLQERDGLPAHGSALIRRAVIDEVGGPEDEFCGLYEDEVFFTKIALSKPVYVTRESDHLYRQHPDSCCARAAVTGEYDFNPAVPNRSRERYLRWLAGYLDAIGDSHPEIRRALARELSPYDHPRLAAVRRAARRWRASAWQRVLQAARLLLPSPVWRVLASAVRSARTS